MKKHLRLICLITACLASCSKSEPPIPVSFDNICQQTGHRVVIDGYLRLPAMGTNCKSNRCMLTLISDLQGRVLSTTALVRNTAKRNSGVNAMEPLPDNFRSEDLRIHMNDGALAAPNTKVKITGDVQKIGDSCQLLVDIIEST
jgi:hypothetical protein